MRITREEQSRWYQTNEWIKVYKSLKFVKPIFRKRCYKCDDLIIGEKMWRETVYVSDIFSFGEYSRFYICQECAKDKMEAFLLFQGREAYNYIVRNYQEDGK